MEQIVYRPYGYCRFLAWLFICLAIVICLLSYYFIPSALVMLIPVFFLSRAGKVIIIVDKSGIQLLNEKTCPSRYLSWDQLTYYQLTSNLRGHDLILLSANPISPGMAKVYTNRGYLSTRLWYDGVLVIPLYSMENSDTFRKFIYQMVQQR